ncbi:MAG: YceI family protein [bacterium]|jgi:polyisoprenoid-binding protein YceI|nr:YceI family protein [bacterium]
MKRILKALSALALIAVLVGVAPAADSYTLDGSHSDVNFTVSHMMISKVRGSFEDFQVDIKLDAADLAKSSVSAVIQAASISTTNEKRDEHLRSADFFETDTYPTITFTSRKIAKKGEQWVATGDYTMHGVTKSIDLPFTLSGPIKDPWGGTRIGIETGLTINRQDYGLSWSNMMDGGGLVVGNDVTIEIHLEAVKQ